MPDSAPNPVPDPATSAARNSLFPEGGALADLDALIATARSRGAAKLLVLAGKSVVCRIDGQLSEPLAPGRVHFSQTERLVTALLSAQQHATLDKDGAVEVDYSPAASAHSAENNGAFTAPVRINIFYGDGAHNLVVFLD